jgi:hypothetical protein
LDRPFINNANETQRIVLFAQHLFTEKYACNVRAAGRFILWHRRNHITNAPNQAYDGSEMNLR